MTASSPTQTAASSSTSPGRRSASTNASDATATTSTTVAVACASCDVCLLDVTGVEQKGPYVLCLECPHTHVAVPASASSRAKKRHVERPVYLCAACVASGREPGAHQKTHRYAVCAPLNKVPSVAVEVAAVDATTGTGAGAVAGWTAAQDFALLWGVERHGYGNWADVSARALTSAKTADECRDRFEHIRVLAGGKPHVPPDMAHVDEKLRRTAAAAASQTPMPGYMPLRGELEVVYANDAEQLLADMTFDADEDAAEPQFRDLKLRVLRNYNLKLEEREFRKRVFLDRNAADSRRLQEARAAITREPDKNKTMLARVEPLARFCERDEFERLVKGLVREQNLRDEIRRLQEFRAMGVRTLADADTYVRLLKRRESAVQNRKARAAAAAAAAAQAAAAASAAAAPSGATGELARGSLMNDAVRQVHAEGGADDVVLTSEERELCSRVDLLPRQYVVVRDAIVKEAMRRGGWLSRSGAEAALVMDVVKTGAVYDFLVHAKWVASTAASSSASASSSGGGRGT